MVDAVFAERFFHLGREFARRLEDQRARHARPGAALFQHGKHRQREGGGLARPVWAMPRTSRPSGVGDGLGLDRRRGVVSRRLDGFEHFLAQAEFIEFHSYSHEGCKPGARSAPRLQAH